ncbi:hypothetical protein J1N35_040959, partial [Gossypium stocksii]
KRTSMHRDMDIQLHEKVIRCLEMMTLCERASVPITAISIPMKPSRSIIGDTLYIQCTKFRQKQTKDWNKHQKEKIDVPTSIKQKAKLIVRQEIGPTNSEHEEEEQEEGENEEKEEEGKGCN